MIALHRYAVVVASIVMLYGQQYILVCFDVMSLIAIDLLQMGK